jgi:biopolymer transport protein ExbD
MKLSRTKPIEEASFDLTPMIDVVLLLIVFFMLSAQFASVDLRPMDLPRERGADKMAESASTVVIELGRDGSLSIHGDPVAMGDLAEAIVGPGGGGGGEGARPGIIVRADRACPASHLNRLAELLATLGVRDWRFATNPDEAPQQPGGSR